MSPLHLAVALDGAGWHPAAWQEPDAEPDRLFTPAYWVGLAKEAERGLLDFITIEDGLDLQSDTRFGPDERTDRVRGRLDAVLIAARVAPVTRHIGLVPTAITTPYGSLPAELSRKIWLCCANWRKPPAITSSIDNALVSPALARLR